MCFVKIVRNRSQKKSLVFCIQYQTGGVFQVRGTPVLYVREEKCTESQNLIILSVQVKSGYEVCFGAHSGLIGSYPDTKRGCPLLNSTDRFDIRLVAICSSYNLYQGLIEVF